MRKAAWIVLCILLLVPCFSVVSAAETVLTLTLSGGTFAYTPEGYYPSADINAYKAELKYSATDNATGEAVEIPIVDVGTYTVTAYVDETYAHAAASAAATVTVLPADVYISVTDVTVAHTAMANPVSYSVYPEWAAELVDISVSYRMVDSLSDYGTEVTVPVDIGTYIVTMEAESLTENVTCKGKYLIYEISETRGSPLSQASSLRSVPISFSADVEDINTIYTGDSVVPQYKLNVAGVESKLMYRLVSSDGVAGTYTEKAPTEPGDYAADCFVLDTVVGSGRIVIEKKPVEIIMEDISLPYSPDGVYIPVAATSPEEVRLKYTAYKYSGGVIGDEVSQPLTECGTYLIKACPENISYYAYTTEYCYLTVERVDPVINGNDASYVEDGEAKNVIISVEPRYAEYTVSYYRLDNKGSASLIDGAPNTPGDYYAVIAVSESKYVNSATAVYGIYIASENSTVRAQAALILKVLCVIFSAVSVALGTFHIVHSKRRERK